MKKSFLVTFLARTGLRSVIGRLVPWSGLLCLNYHRIGSATGSPFDHGLWSADEDNFDTQVRFLKSHFDLVSPADLPHVLQCKTGRYVLITFDDGYRDNFTSAFPILKRNGAPATFFISAGFLDSPHLPWWDEIAWMVRTSRRNRIELRPWVPEPIIFDAPVRERAVRVLLRAYKAIRSESTPQLLTAIADATESGRCHSAAATQGLWMTWDMVREMRAAGMTIGGHTVTHPILGQMPPHQQWQEVSHCGERLQTELGEPMRYFSYPVGSRTSFNSDTRACLERVGVDYAFSYYGGINRFNAWDKFDLRRVAVETEITPHWFRALVTLPQVFTPNR